MGTIGRWVLSPGLSHQKKNLQKTITYVINLVDTTGARYSKKIKGIRLENTLVPGIELQREIPGFENSRGASGRPFYSCAGRRQHCKGVAKRYPLQTADDDSFLKMAQRIKARAIRRTGELLKQIEKASNQHVAKKRAEEGTPLCTRTQAAQQAGLSPGPAEAGDPHGQRPGGA